MSMPGSACRAQIVALELGMACNSGGLARLAGVPRGFGHQAVFRHSKLIFRV